MGGRGSGRFWHGGAKATVDCCQSIDVRRWQREGLLAPDCFLRGLPIRRDGLWMQVLSPGQVRLSYRCRQGQGDWEEMDYRISLEATACHFGGVRHWFRCPAIGCGRRVAKLYLGGRYFACRHCQQLAYQSQREAPYERMARRANAIRERLGWQYGIFESPEGKPKGMHWRTFERLSANAEQAAREALGAFGPEALVVVGTQRQ